MITLRFAITATNVERAYKMATLAQKRGSSRDWTWCQQGLTAARAQDPRLLLALDRAAEVLHRMHEEQLGRTQRDTSVDASLRATPTEVAFWREAYKCADRGTPLEPASWVYAAAGWLAGVVQAPEGLV